MESKADIGQLHRQILLHSVSVSFFLYEPADAFCCSTPSSTYMEKARCYRFFFFFIFFFSASFSLSWFFSSFSVLHQSFYFIFTILPRDSTCFNNFYTKNRPTVNRSDPYSLRGVWRLMNAMCYVLPSSQLPAVIMGVTVSFLVVLILNQFCIPLFLCFHFHCFQMAFECKLLSHARDVARFRCDPPGLRWARCQEIEWTIFCNFIESEWLS